MGDETAIARDAERGSEPQWDPTLSGGNVTTISVLALAMTFKRRPEAFTTLCPRALLIATPIAGEKPIRGTGIIDLSVANSSPGDPVAHEIVKASLGAMANAFPFGVTIGHAENNDIVLRHPDVSRFHAFIQTQNGKNFIVDTGSRNGTTAEGQRLTPSRPWPLPPIARLSLGSCEVAYVEPGKFGIWLAEYSARTTLPSL